MTQEILDRQRAIEHMDGDEELLAEVVKIFLHDAPRSLQNLREAHDRNDAADVRRHAHSLKGAAAAIAAEAVGAAAARLETAAASGSTDAFAPLLADLENELERFIALTADRVD